jgi:hypothetical protein
MTSLADHDLLTATRANVLTGQARGDHRTKLTFSATSSNDRTRAARS